MNSALIDTTRFLYLPYMSHYMFSEAIVYAKNFLTVENLDSCAANSSGFHSKERSLTGFLLHYTLYLQLVGQGSLQFPDNRVHHLFMLAVSLDLCLVRAVI